MGLELFKKITSVINKAISSLYLSAQMGSLANASKNLFLTNCKFYQTLPENKRNFKNVSSKILMSILEENISRKKKNYIPISLTNTNPQILKY